MIIKLIAAVLCMCSSVAVAETKQLNVVGIIPGVTTKEDLIAVSTKQVGRVVYLDIGGYNLPCVSEFIENVVGLFGCGTGDEFTEATNLEIHETLVKGFTKKFGKPDINVNTPVQTALGKHQVNEVWWFDKKGNALTLYSMENRLDQGRVMMMSVEKMKKMRDEREQANRARKF